MGNNKISVIVPIYNLDGYLDKCISSIINQTYSDLEIILINDGSTDDSGQICEKYKAQDGRIVVIHQENQGVSIARNKGLNIATGDYIGFVDADDWIDEDMYEVLHINMLKYNAAISMCRHKYINQDNIYVPEELSEDTVVNGTDILKFYLSEYHTTNIINDSVWCKLYRSSSLNNIRFPEHQTYEDILFTCKALINANRLVISSECLYNYNMRSNSIVHMPLSLKSFDIIKANIQRYEYIKSMHFEYELLCRKLLLKELIDFLYRIVAAETVIMFNNEILYVVEIVKQLNIHNCGITESEIKLLTLLCSDLEKAFIVMKKGIRMNRIKNKRE